MNREIKSNFDGIRNAIEGLHEYHQECRICKKLGHRPDMIKFKYEFYHKECFKGSEK